MAKHQNGMRTWSASVDIAVVAAVSLAFYTAETVMRSNGAIPWGEESRGALAVLGGAAAAIALVFLRGQSLSAIGFFRPKRLWVVPLWAIAIFIVFVIGQNMATAFVASFIDLPAPDLSRYEAMQGNPAAALQLLLLLPLTAALPEEIIYRGFLMNRLAAIYGDGPAGVGLAVLTQAMVFGAIHFAWGPGGVFFAVTMGLIWGTAYVLCGRNLWIVIAAHSLTHVAFVAQIYFVDPVRLT